MRTGVLTVNRPRCVIPLCAVGLCLLIASSHPANAQGKLDAFENDATSSQPDTRTDRRTDQDRHHRGHERHSDRSWTGDMIDACGSWAAIAFVYGGECSWMRVADATNDVEEVPPRLPGEPLLPLVRIDLAYQNIGSDIKAVDTRVEGGYGPIALDFNMTLFDDEASGDNLDIVRVIALYRMSFGAYAEIDLGCGALTLNGEGTTTMFAMAAPILVHPGGNLGLEFRPAVAGHISDYDLAAMLTWQYVSLKAGYRWLYSPNESLHGPYIGLSWRL